MIKPLISVLGAVGMIANSPAGQHKDNPTQIPIGTPRTQTGHMPAKAKVSHHHGAAKHKKPAPKPR